jgi:hypothetical protein
MSIAFYEQKMVEIMQEMLVEAKEQTEEMAEQRRHLKRIGDILDKKVNL